MPPALLLDFTAVAVLAGFMVYVRQRRPPARLYAPLEALSACGLLIALGDAITATAGGLGWEWFGVMVLYLGLYGGVGQWLILCVRWRRLQRDGRTGRSWLEAAAWSYTGAAIAVVLSSPLHGMLVTPVIGERNIYHALWWVLAGLSYLCVASAGVLYGALAGALGSASRRGTAGMALASLGLLVGNGLYVLWPSSLPFDPTLLAIMMACAAAVYGIERQGLFQLRPGILPQVLEADPDGVVLIGDDERPIWCNAAARSLVPLSAERPVLQQLVEGLASNEQRGEMAATLRSLCERQDLPGSVLLPVGKSRRRYLQVEALRPRVGSRSVLVLRLRDTTDSERQRREREELEERYRRLVHSAPVGILGCEPDGKIVVANPRMVDLLDLPSEGALADGNVFELPVLETIGIASLIRRCLDRGQPVSEEIEQETQWGRTLDLQVDVEVVRNGGEAVAGAIALVQDITEQRQVELERRQLELQRLEAQKLENLGVLAGGVAHDFNNLLQAILGNAELGLQAELGSSSLQHRLDEIRSVSLLAADIVRQLLAYAGKVQPKRENVDLSKVVREMRSLVEMGAARRCSYELDLAEGLPEVDADPAQVRQVVLNLALNAAEAIEHEEGMVSIVTRLSEISRDELRGAVMGAEQLPGPRVLLEVRDNGSGMDEVTRSRIFDPFFSTKFEGRGLGLATVQGILRQHDAALDVRSAPGEGSVFRVWFQLAGVEGRMPLPIPSAEASECEAVAEGLALVVDDETAVAAVVARGLEKSGFVVETTERGGEALELLQRRPGEIGLVVLDAAMPEMSGETTVRRLREIDPRVPVLLISGSAEEDAISPAGRGLVSGFLRKPFTMVELRRAVAAAVGHARRQ